MLIMGADMLSRSFRVEESRARFWAQKAVELCSEIEDESLTEYIQPILDADKALERDRRIIFIGAAGSGKSALLAGIAECPLMARIPIEDDYVCWRYRSKDGDATCSRFIPHEELEGLELVDTRDCADERVAATVRTLLKGADVVVAVIDGRTPETSPIWPLIAELNEKQRAACLLAITYTDTLAAESTLKLKESLRDFCRERVGIPLPLYCVSPTSGTDSLGTFRDRIQSALGEPVGVRSAIRRLVEAAKELTRKQATVLGARDRVARTDSGFLAGIEQEIDYFLDRQRDRLNSCREAYAEAAMRALPTTVDKLQRTLGWFLSPVTLLRMELLGTGTEKFYYRTLRTEVLTQQESSDDNFMLSCMKHWASVRPRMKKTLECEIGEFPADELMRDLEEQRVRMGRELYKPFAKLQLRSTFNREFNAHVGWMSACCAAMCLFFFMAGILGLLDQMVPAMMALMVVALIWIGGSLAHYLTVRHLCREIVQLSLNLQEELKSSIGTAIEALLVSRVAAYRRLYTAPREKVARHDASLKPLQQKQKDINMQLNAAAPRM